MPPMFSQSFISEERGAKIHFQLVSIAKELKLGPKGEGINKSDGSNRWAVHHKNPVPPKIKT